MGRGNGSTFAGISGQMGQGRGRIPVRSTARSWSRLSISRGTSYIDGLSRNVINGEPSAYPDPPLSFQQRSRTTAGHVAFSNVCFSRTAAQVYGSNTRLRFGASEEVQPRADDYSESDARLCIGKVCAGEA